MNAYSILRFLNFKKVIKIINFKKGTGSGRRMFCSRNIPVIQIKKVNEIEKMIAFIENAYSESIKKEVTYWDEHSYVANIRMTKEPERLYKIWENFHCSNDNKKMTNNVFLKRKGYKEENKMQNEKNIKDIFQFCSNIKEEPFILKNKVIGIYIPKNINIYTDKVNYFYLFQKLKDVLNGKLFYDIYFILPNYIFLLSFVDIFKNLIFYEMVVEHTKSRQQKNMNERYRNQILRKIYKHKIENLKKKLGKQLEKIFADKKYTKIMYEDSMELSSFLFRFLKIQSSEFIDLHHLYQYVVSLYELSLSKHSIFYILPIFFPEFYNTRLVYEIKRNTDYFLKYDKEKDKNRKKKNFFLKQQWNKFIIDIWNCNESNEIIFFEKQLIHMLYLFPLANKLLVKHKDSEGLNITYKMNNLIHKYNSLNNINNYDLKKKYEIVTKKKGERKNKKEFVGTFLNSFYKKLYVAEEKRCHHTLIIGKHIYGYIYEMNKVKNHIVLRFNLHSKHITFENIYSTGFEESETIETVLKKRQRKYSVPNLFKKIKKDLYKNNTTIANRNITIFNYSNNILDGLIYDEEKNFVYFSDKNIGDIVLCTIKDISACGKYIYVERYDTKNLIFHFRKEKYINLEKNFDYDNADIYNDETLKKILGE